MRRGDGRSFVVEHGQLSDRFNRVVTFASLCFQILTIQLHRYMPELSVVVLVPGDISQHIVSSHIIVNAAKAGFQIVCVVNKKAASLICELPEAAPGIESQ